MKIKINGEEKAVNNGLTLKKLIEDELKTNEPKGVAAAVNETIVPKQKWEETMINENDEIEIVHAVQGG
jgi:sulfur carrier protein